MLPLTVALTTATLALVGNIFFNSWNLYHERSSIAAALAGEIEAFEAINPPPNNSNPYRDVAKLDNASRRMRLLTAPKPSMSNPVFDKVADKIGLLPPAEARDVSKVYYVFSSIRLFIAHLSDEQFAKNADEAVQIKMLNDIAGFIDANYKDAHSLVGRLDQISKQSFIAYLQS